MSCGLQFSNGQFKSAAFDDRHSLHAVVVDLLVIESEPGFRQGVERGLLQIVQVAAAAIRHMALNAYFHGCGQADIQH